MIGSSNTKPKLTEANVSGGTATHEDRTVVSVTVRPRYAMLDAERLNGNESEFIRIELAEPCPA